MTKGVPAIPFKPGVPILESVRSADVLDSIHVSQSLQRLARKMHRSLAPIILLPIAITSLTGGLYPMLREVGVSKSLISWMMKIHAGDFVIIDLSPIYPFIVGLSTAALAITGLLMVLRASHQKPAA